MSFMTRFGAVYLVCLNTIWFNVWILENDITSKRLKKIEDKLEKLGNLTVIQD
jgi:hypothetical protein